MEGVPMFITVKSKIQKKTYRTILFVVIAFLCVVVIVIACVLQNSPKQNIECENGEYSAVLSSDNGEKLFASQFSKEIEEKVYEKLVHIPYEFSDTYEEYNELQLLQGLDLSLYKGKECTLSVFSLKNYTIDYKKAYMTILSIDDTVIGGHISTFENESEMYTFYGE